jgi:2-dehydropantoate 2-reductase
MRILVLGAGVIGAIYAWQLAEAGHAVTLFARPERKERIVQYGISIRCRDERNKPPAVAQTVYRPNAVDTISPDAGYELIIVSICAPTRHGPATPCGWSWSGRCTLVPQHLVG